MTVKEIGELIKEQRQNYKLTTRELAQITGVSWSLIKSLEAGKRNPTFDSLTKIIDALGMELMIKFK